MALNLSPAKLDAWMRRKKGKQNLIERDAPGMRLRGARTLNEMDALEPYDDPEAQTTSDDAEFDAMVNAANAKKAQRESAKTKATPTQEPSQEPPVGYREETSEDLKNPDEEAPQTPETNEARRKGIYMSGLENLEPAAEEAVETPEQESKEGAKWNDPTQLNELLYKDESKMTPQEKAAVTPKETSYFNPGEDDGAQQQQLEADAFDAGEVPGADALGAAAKPSAEPAKPANQDLTDDDVTRILGKKPGRLSNIGFMLTGGLVGENRLGYNREANDLKMLRQKSNESIRMNDPKLLNALEKEEIKVEGKKQVAGIQGDYGLAKERERTKAMVQRGEISAAQADRIMASKERIAQARREADKEEAIINGQFGLDRAEIAAGASKYTADQNYAGQQLRSNTSRQIASDKLDFEGRKLTAQQAMARDRNATQVKMLADKLAMQWNVTVDNNDTRAGIAAGNNATQKNIAEDRMLAQLAINAAKQDLAATAVDFGISKEQLKFLVDAARVGDDAAISIVAQVSRKMRDDIMARRQAAPATPAEGNMVNEAERTDRGGRPPLGK